MSPFFGELVGTGMLIVLGQGVVENVVLAKTKGQNSGWIVISFGWAIAVFVGVYCAASSSKAHLNPAVTLAFAALGKFTWAQVPVYVDRPTAGGHDRVDHGVAVLSSSFFGDCRGASQAGRLLHGASYPQHEGITWPPR